ncbi:hypothetical protein GCM10009780_55080 [Actinomadura alba]
MALREAAADAEAAAGHAATAPTAAPVTRKERRFTLKRPSDIKGTSRGDPDIGSLAASRRSITRRFRSDDDPPNSSRRTGDARAVGLPALERRSDRSPERLAFHSYIEQAYAW